MGDTESSPGLGERTPCVSRPGPWAGSRPGSGVWPVCVRVSVTDSPIKGLPCFSARHLHPCLCLSSTARWPPPPAQVGIPATPDSTHSHWPAGLEPCPSVPVSPRRFPGVCCLGLVLISLGAPSRVPHLSRQPPGWLWPPQPFTSSPEIHMGFPGGSAGKESACSAGDLGWEHPLEEGTATHSSILVWRRIPWTLYSMGSTERLSTHLRSTRLGRCLRVTLASRS